MREFILKLPVLCNVPSRTVKKIGVAKTITSNDVTLDRDLNGARGIFLRALGDNPLLFDEYACVIKF